MQFRRLREEKVLTQEQFAALAGITEVGVRKIEKAKQRRLQQTTLQSLAQGLGMTLDELVDELHPEGGRAKLDAAIAEVASGKYKPRHTLFDEIGPGTPLDCHGSHIARPDEMVWAPLDQATARALMAQADAEGIPHTDLIMQMLAERGDRKEPTVTIEGPGIDGTQHVSPSGEIRPPDVPPGEAKPRKRAARDLHGSQKEGVRKAR